MVQQHWGGLKPCECVSVLEGKTPFHFLSFKYKLETKSWWLSVGIERGGSLGKKGFFAERKKAFSA